MTIKRVMILLWLGILFIGSAHALPIIPGPVFKIPPEIQAITDVDSLRLLIRNPAFKNKISFYMMRLGEIGGEAELPLLMEVFNSEPYYSAIEVISHVKYYSLISMGKIGGATAEEFLRKVVNSLSPNIRARTNSFTRADSLATIVGALEGLGKIGTPSVGAFLDSVFHNADNTWVVRSSANLEALKIELKNNRALATAADTASFLLDKWRAVPWAEKQFSAAGVVPDYLVRDHLEALIFEYRAFMLPHVRALESEMAMDNPKAAALAKLRQRMESTPPDTEMDK